MTKYEMATAFQEKTGVRTKKAATEYVEAVLDIIVDEIKSTREFRYHEFGTFKVQQRAARKGRNPHTGEEINIAARKVVKFKPAPAVLRELGEDV